jgi:predicted DNA-binding transcriptional regulator YafY
MSKQGYIRRYSLIIELVSTNRFPSLTAIRNFLFDNGFEISMRTVQRDIEQIRYEFGIEITYEHERNGYFIDTEKSFNIDGFLRFLEIANTAELFMESLKESKDTLSFIQFESLGQLRGIENLKPLLFAIKNQRIIRFQHQNFHTGDVKTFTINPYLLKEYQNRWYLIGKIGYRDFFISFGIDRITGLKVMETFFEQDAITNPAALFENIIGLSESESEPQEIILSFTPIQGKYIKSLPLHKSQQIILDDETELRIKLMLVPNFEFKQKILMLGEAVKVIKPSGLVKEIKQALKNALAQY